jgi:hypothetical protein
MTGEVHDQRLVLGARVLPEKPAESRPTLGSLRSWRTLHACVACVAPVRTGGWLVTCTIREPLQAEDVEAFLLQGRRPLPIGA